MEKGVIIEYLNVNETDPWTKMGYIYPKNIVQTLEETYEWVSKTRKELDSDETKQYIRPIPWKLDTYSCIKVYRNKKWWNKNFSTINAFWDSVLHYRKIGYESLIKTKKPRKVKTVQEQEYKFLSDSDNEF